MKKNEHNTATKLEFRVGCGNFSKIAKRHFADFADTDCLDTVSPSILNVSMRFWARSDHKNEARTAQKRSTGFNGWRARSVVICSWFLMCCGCVMEIVVEIVFSRVRASSSSSLYNLTPEKQNKTEKFIKENLDKGYI